MVIKKIGVLPKLSTGSSAGSRMIAEAKEKLTVSLSSGSTKYLGQLKFSGYDHNNALIRAPIKSSLKITFAAGVATLAAPKQTCKGNKCSSRGWQYLAWGAFSHASNRFFRSSTHSTLV